MRKEISAATTLRRLMTTHRLSQADVAALAAVSVKSVESWLAKPAAGYYRNMPPRHIKLIQAVLPHFLAARRAGKSTTQEAST